MNQANADQDYPGDLTDDLANAGGDEFLGGEAHESEAGSANHRTELDGDPSGDAGREGEADVLDEIDSIDAYQRHLDSLDVDALGDEAPDPDDQPEATEPEPEEEEEDPDDQPEDAPENGKVKPVRIAPLDEVERLAFAMRKADRTIRLEDALAMARARLGLPAPSPDAPADETPADEPADTDSVASLRQNIIEARRCLIAKRKEFSDSYDASVMEEIAQIEEQILDLETRLPEVEAREAERVRLAQEQDAAWDRAAAAAWENVKVEYPQALDPNSTFATRMREIDEAWQEAGDARFDDAAKVEVIARIVAKELGARPASARPVAKPNGRTLPVPASSRTSSTPSRPASPVVVPASGSARTAGGSTEFGEALAKVSTPEAYERLRDRLLGA